MAYDTGEPRHGLGEDATDATGQSYRDFRPRSSRSTGKLDDVFDDPNHGDVGRDRLGVHFAWEAVLAVGTVIVGFLLYSNHRDSVSGVEMKHLLAFGAALGVLTFGAAMSLRVAAPNLAIGPIAAAAAIFYADRSEAGVVPATVTAAAFALALGIVIAVLVVGFHVPAWAGTLVAACAAIVWIQKKAPTVEVAGEYAPSGHALYLFGGFAAVSVIAGLLGAIKSIRRGLGRFRPVADPSLRRGGFAGTMAALGLIGSSVLAAVGGVLLAALWGEQDVAVAPGLGLDLTVLALGAAMIGGVSAYGRRGGVFGTLLAVSLVSMFIQYVNVANWRISTYAIGGGAVVIGLIVTRLVETFGRPLAIDDDDDWSDLGVAGTGVSWSTGSGDTWSNLPAQPAAPTGPWAGNTDDRWSSIR